MSHKVKLGDRVRVKCLRVRNQRDARHKRRKPRTFEFTVGSREVLPGLSAGVEEMAPGDRKRLTLQPLEAYGPVQQCLIREIPRRRFPNRIALKTGKMLTRIEPVSGHREWVRIVELKLHWVVVDGNPPLAGEVVQLDVMLISVDSSSNANLNKQQFEMGGEG